MCLLAALSICEVYGQERSLRFEHLSLEQGLSQSTVKCILQDSYGFIWIGTEHGLNRYDGYRFSVYGPDSSDPQSLSGFWISALYEDRQGTLWVGTEENGLNRFNREAETFVHYRHRAGEAASLGSDRVRAIFEDQSGTLWVGTDGGGLNRLDRQTDTFTRFPAPNPETPPALDKVYALGEDGAGKLWVGSRRDGLYLLDPASGATRRAPLRPEGLPKRITRPEQISALHTDHLGDLWVATHHGLHRRRSSTNQWMHYRHEPSRPHSLSHNDVRAILEDRAGYLWVATYGGGLDRFDRASQRFEHHRRGANGDQGLSSDKLTALYEDRTGLLWVGTDGGGVHTLDPARITFAHYPAPLAEAGDGSGREVWAFEEDPGGNLWVGTKGGLHHVARASATEGTTGRGRYYDLDRGIWRHNNMIRSIHQDAAGNVWIGTNTGLNRLDPRTGRVTPYLHQPRHELGNHVWTVLPDSAGLLWLGSQYGLTVFDPATEQAKTYVLDPEAPDQNIIKTLFGARDGSLWVGTWTGGLARFDPATGAFVRYVHDTHDAGSLSHNYVTSIHEDRQGALWVGTGNGLNRLDPEKGTFSHYTEEDGLPSSSIACLLEDLRGRLWLSTRKGLARMDPVTETFLSFDVRDGLQSDEFIDGACLKDAGEVLLFGGVNGFNAFHPDSVHTAEAPPDVAVTSFRVFDQEVRRFLRSGERLTLSHRDNFFSFELAVLDYRDPSRNQYAYRLEGFDPDWVYAGSRRYVSYTNLAGGTYDFRVRGANSKGQWSEREFVITLTIVPPFWKTRWFTVVVLVVGLALTVGGGYLWQRRISRRRLKQAQAEARRRLAEGQYEERRRIARELHDGPVQDLDYLLAYPVATLADRLNGDARGDELALVRQTLQNAVEELREVSENLRPPELAHFGLESALRLYVAHFSREHPSLEVELETRYRGKELPEWMQHDLYRICQEALRNVAKHAQARHVWVRLVEVSEKLRLEVQDDGIGFSKTLHPKAATGRHERWRLGLLGIAERARAMEGTVMVDSEPGRGTLLRVVVDRPRP